MRRNEKGFTLVELLVVVAILGVLAAVIIPNVTGFIDKNEAKQIQESVTLMMADKGLTLLPNPVAEAQATDNMKAFPDPGYPLCPDYCKKSSTRQPYWAKSDGTVFKK